MRILAWVAGVVIVVAAAVGGYLVTQRDDDSGGTTRTESSEVRTGEQADSGATKTACDVFTEAVAKGVLGASARKGELPSQATASTNDVTVSTCVYDNGSADIRAVESAAVLVRGAKTGTGKTGNEFGFNNNKTLDKSGGTTGTSESINDLGDEAYWNASFGQVNVLVDDGKYWLIVNVGTMDKAKSQQLAQAVVENL